MSLDFAGNGDGGSEEEEEEKSSPILIFRYFHKAIRSELQLLHDAAVEMATTTSGGDMSAFADRCRFLFAIYKHHCNAEDAVVFPALDKRVKNVARAYSLEHKGEEHLFDQFYVLLQSYMQNDDSYRRELASCVGAIQTSLYQHLFKEEEQVFPLLIEKFSYEEQANLVWQFLCNIPVNMVSKFFSWLSSHISHSEHQKVLKFLYEIVPDEKLLKQVIFTWMEAENQMNTGQLVGADSLLRNSFTYRSGKLSNEIKEIYHQCQSNGAGKRKHEAYNDCDSSLPETDPINEILHWHNAIRRELISIAEEARRIQRQGELSDLSTFSFRVQFIADVCIFHSIAEDQIIFPEVNRGISFTMEHAEEETQLKKFRCFLEQILNSGDQSTSEENCTKLCSHAEKLLDTIERHFHNEEAEVLPFARMYFSREKQRDLLYKSVCVMPLRLLEHVLPWLCAMLSDKEASLFLQNIQLAASSCDDALVALFSCWASKGRCENIFRPRKFMLLPSKEHYSCQVEQADIVGQDRNTLLSGEHSEKRLAKRGTTCTIRKDSLPLSATSPLLHCIPSALSLGSSLFFWETEMAASSIGNVPKPIDTIFKFHKAIRKDLEYLDTESVKLINSDDAFLRQFSGRFRLLWGLYRAHSNAEDDIVFPALESKEALHNVSHSYTLDHKQEDKLFKDIAEALTELAQMHEGITRTLVGVNIIAGDRYSSSNDSNWVKKRNDLATKLQGMCKSIKVSLDQHLSREELELWPLFDKFFCLEDQDKLVGRIIGTTGAEVLQSMLPWVTSALTQEEQNEMMDTWREAAKNTMFNEWLNEWWKDTPSSSEPVSENPLPCKGTECQVNLDDSNHMFKPGWKDIFRMNQSELESEIRTVSSDPSLDPKRKAYLIQNLLTSRWMASQQKLRQESEIGDADSVDACSPSFRDSEKQIFGCEHYKRNCKIFAACCNKLFTCRFCHDKVSDHSMDRKATRKMMCMRCLKIQVVDQTCKTPSCEGYSMAIYYCSICKFFDDERTVYHCPFCNLCRLGEGLGVDSFHCMKCNCCLSIKLVNHKCLEKGLESNCPICCDFLFTSSGAIRALPCGHFMHSACFQAYTCSHYTCPICCKSLGDMTVYFGMLDALLAAEELPEEYKDRFQDILCNDCEKKGKSRFHWLYHKCGFCGSYNTRVIQIDANNCTTSIP